MTWGALLKTVGQGVAKKVSGAAKKKGSEMAKKIVNKKEESKQSAIVIREKSTALIPISKADGEEDSSIQKSESSSSPLERIRSTLLDIIETLKKRRKLVLDRSRKDRVQADKIKKGKREGLLEKMKSGGKKMLSNVASAASGWWERLQKFLLMTMLGSLVLAIKNNWEAIQEKIKETVEFVKELWENLEPILTPIWKGLMWIVKKGFGLVKPLFGMSKESKEIEQGTDEVSKGLEEVKKKTSWIEGLFKKSKEDTEKLKDEDYTKEFKNLEKMESEDKENPGDDLKEIEQTVEGVKDKIAKIKLDLPKFEEGAVPVPETGPAIVHKGEVIIPAPIVKQVGGPMNIVNLIEMGRLPGLGGGGGGTNAITAKAQTKSLGKRAKDVGNLLARSFRKKEDRDPLTQFASLSEDLPPAMMEKMNETLASIKEQTEYEDPSGTTIFIPLPPSNQSSSSGGGNGGSGTNMVTVGDSTAATLNKYREALIQAALY